MKKLLVLMLVFGMASLANATIIDVVKADFGDQGHAGTSLDPLVPSETIAIKIVLNNNPYPDFPTWDGYVTDAMNLDLEVSGPGTLGVVMLLDKYGNPTTDPDLKHHADWDVWSQSDPLIASNAIASMMGGSMGYIRSTDVVQDLVWNLLLHCDGDGFVTLDLTLAGVTRIWDYWDPIKSEPFGTSYNAVEGDLGGLIIHQIPEPATIALLGLGGLCLLRRRR